MNYVAAVYVVVMVIVTIDWFARGRREFHGAGVQEAMTGSASIVTATGLHVASSEEK